jgi:hypothetical protein
VIVFAIVDRLLDLIGLGTVLYWTVRLTLKAARHRRRA